MASLSLDYTVHSIVESRVMKPIKLGDRTVNAEMIGVAMELVRDGAPTIRVEEMFSTDAEHADFLASYHAAQDYVAASGVKPSLDAWDDAHPKPADHVDYHPGQEARAASVVTVTIAPKS